MKVLAIYCIEIGHIFRVGKPGSDFYHVRKAKARVGQHSLKILQCLSNLFAGVACDDTTIGTPRKLP